MSAIGYQYEQLDATTRLNLIRARIKDLENQHFNLALRVNTPDLTMPINGQDQTNLTTLTTSLDQLKNMEQELVKASNPAPPAAASS